MNSQITNEFYKNNGKNNNSKKNDLKGGNQTYFGQAVKRNKLRGERHVNSKPVNR